MHLGQLKHTSPTYREGEIL